MNGFTSDEIRALIEGAPDALLVIGRRGIVRAANPAAERLFGRQHLVGSHYRSLLSDEFSDLFAQACQELAVDPGIRQVGSDLDVFVCRDDGSSFPVEVNFGLVPGSEDSEIVASVRDVSLRHRSETDLREALSLLSATLESTADGILVVSAEGQMTGYNERFVTLWRIPPDVMESHDDERAIGYVLNQLVDPDAFVAKVHALYHAPEEESNDVLHFWDGRVFERYSRPQRVGDEIVGRVWSFRDVTPRVQAQREAEDARAAALEASRAKSDFLATMSHEIRTPMNGVIGLTGLLLNTELDDVQRKYAAGVRGAGQALLGIVDDILDFSKLEAGKVDLEDVPFSPRHLVEEVGVLLAEAAENQGLEFVVNCDASVPTAVRGDPGRLRQTLINLTGNAIKFTPTGEVSVTVRVEDGHTSATGGSVALRFEVRDTGIGIAADTIERIFEPFSQADASTTRLFGGTGLGLAISRRLVTAMGGHLSADSEPGRGSTFGFTLRLGMAPGEPSPPVNAATLTSLRALVVDDNETNRRVLVGQLAGSGVRAADAVADADAALAALRGAHEGGTPYDVALLDLLMPGTDGLTLARSIAADPALRTTRVLLLSSGEAPPDDDMDAVTAWLSKPVREGELAQALRRLTPPAAETEPKPERRTAPDRAGRVVLVAEDNPVNQIVALGFLEELGYEAEVVSDGAEALTALETGRFDVVLMDCHMPGLDGFEATRRLRAAEGAGPRTPVIAMTAGVLDEDRERCLAAGMDDFLPKPIDISLMRRTLGRWTTTDVEPSAPPVLEQERLDALRAVGMSDGWGVLPDVIRLFLSDAAQQRAALNAAVASRDTDRVAQVLHGLKGAAANLGVPAVAEACSDAEQRLRAGAPVPEELGLLVCQELDRACTELEKLLALASAGPGR